MNDVLELIVGAPVRLEELKHKPARRRTMRARGPKGSAIVKIYASRRAAVVAQRVASLAEGPSEPVVPTVLYVDEGRHTVVLSDVPGRPFREALLDGDVATCMRVGVAVGAWHAAWRGVSPGALQPHTAEREAAILRALAEAASPPVAKAVSDALPYLTEPWGATTVVHRDLYEEQILVDQRVGLIDLDDAASAPPELDVGNLIAHVELLELRCGRDLSSEKRALLDAYVGVEARFNHPLFDCCRRLTLLRLACLNDDVSLASRAVAESAFT